MTTLHEEKPVASTIPSPVPADQIESRTIACEDKVRYQVLLLLSSYPVRHFSVGIYCV